MVCGIGMALAACDDTIEIGGKMDETGYGALSRIDGRLVDDRSARNELALRLTSDNIETAVRFTLTRTAGKGVDALVAFDADYLEVYNEIHGTSCLLFPEESIDIANDGKVLLAPDDKTSGPVSIMLKSFEKMQSGMTYLLPLSVSSVTEGITIDESVSRVVYLVKDGRLELSADKGPDAVKNIVFFELGDANPLNALEFKLQNSGKLFFDYVVLFSGNINYDPQKNRVYFSRNKELQFLLDHNEEYLQPLRKCGIKVILGVLGNHDDSGLAQLSAPASRDFAAELAAFCETYDLDGVCFDDEYSNASPDLNNPLFTVPSSEAAARLLYETKKAMPDRTVMVYYLGHISPYLPAVDGLAPGLFVDIAVADYSSYNPAASPMKGMDIGNCSGASIELNELEGDWTTETARRQKEAGYGYYMFFSLNPEWYSTKNQVNMLRSVASGLYGETLQTVTHFYPQQSTQRKNLSIPQ